MTTQRTTSRKTIEKMSSNPSKQEEIDFLRAVIDSIPKDSYLAALLDEKLFNYAERGIRNDIMISVDSDFFSLEAMKEEFEDRIRDEQRMSEILARDLEAARKQVEDMKSVVAEKEAMIDKARKVLNGYGW